MWSIEALVSHTEVSPVDNILVETENTQDNEPNEESDDKYLSQHQVKAIHEKFGHPGVSRMMRLCRLFGGGTTARKKTIKAVIDECARCICDKRLLPANMVGKKTIGERPRQIIAIDHFSPFTDTDDFGFNSILSLKDAFSKHVTIFPCRTKSHQEVAEYLRTYFMIMGNGAIQSIRADNFFRSESILKDLASEFDFTWDFSPVIRPQANGQVERIHADLRKIIPWILETLKIPTHKWSLALPHAAIIMNSVPHTAHGHPPEVVQFGSLSTGLCIDPDTTLSKEIKTLWRHVKEQLRTRQTEQSKGVAGPFCNFRLNKGDKVFAILSKNVAVKATVIHDFGEAAWIEKETGPKRFSKVVVHKSLLTRRLEFNVLPDQ